MPQYIRKTDAVEAMEFRGIDSPDWPHFCAWCVEHGVSIILAETQEIDEDGNEVGKPVKVVKLDGYKMIGVGEFALLGKYSHVEVMDAADFGQKYMATEPIAKAAATAKCESAAS